MDFNIGELEDEKIEKLGGEYQSKQGFFSFSSPSPSSPIPPYFGLLVYFATLVLNRQSVEQKGTREMCRPSQRAKMNHCYSRNVLLVSQLVLPKLTRDDGESGAIPEEARMANIKPATGLASCESTTHTTKRPNYSCPRKTLPGRRVISFYFCVPLDQESFVCSRQHQRAAWND